MQPLTIDSLDVKPFTLPCTGPLDIAGQTVNERRGFYLSIKTTDGLQAQGEGAPLEGINPESAGRVRHDIKQIQAFAQNLRIPGEKEELLEFLRHEAHVVNACGSVRFAVESAFFTLACQAAGQSLVEFLGGTLKDVPTAFLLQGSHSAVMSDFKKFSRQGFQVFKLKVGDRNIALDVKKVNDMRLLLEAESYLRLDANRRWSLKEACIFAELIANNQRIDFIEEPIRDPGQLDAFYQKTRMRVGLDETLQVMLSGVHAPGRCSSPLAEQEGVIAYVLKPMVLGFIATLDWIAQAKLLKRKAIVSSLYESPVGFKVLANLACLSGQIAGLGTERWLKIPKPIVGGNGIIQKEALV